MAAFSARSLLLADNRRMLGKLLVIALLMFGFGYALVPMYRAICEALGVNVLSLAEQRRADAAAGRSQQYPDRHVAHGDRGVRCQRARPLGLQARQDVGDGAPGRNGHGDVRVPHKQNRTMAAQAIPSYAPKQAMAHFNKLECFASTNTR